jgi:hypothetical protein
MPKNNAGSAFAKRPQKAMASQNKTKTTTNEQYVIAHGLLKYKILRFYVVIQIALILDVHPVPPVRLFRPTHMPS